MKLIYSGNDYKYDTEAIMKLFLPAQSFDFVYDTYAEPAGDYAFMRKRVLRGAILLYVIAQYGGRKDKAVCRLPLAACRLRLPSVALLHFRSAGRRPQDVCCNVRTCESDRYTK